MTDPTDEPDLLTALALSLDRARARRAQAQPAQGSPAATPEGDPASEPAPIAPAPSQADALLRTVRRPWGRTVLRNRFAMDLRRLEDLRPIPPEESR